MSTRTRLPEPLRIQLEGALEVLERGERLYASFARQLSGSDWKRRLRSHPRLLAEVRAHEPVLAEAFVRVERRARQEQWPPEHPLPGLLRATRERQARLESLARERLTRWGWCGDASFGEVLAELEARVLEPVVSLPEYSEEVRFQVYQGRALPALPWVLPVLLEVGWIMALAGWLPPWALGLLVVALAGALVAWCLQAPGGFWLTRERMVWRPRSGETVQARLSSLSAGDVELLPEGSAPGSVGLRVRGARSIAIRALRLLPEEWVTLLRALPPPEGDASPEEAFVLVRASLVSGSIRRRQLEGTHGLLVLQARAVAFVPARNEEVLGLWEELLTRVGHLSPRALERFVWMAVDRQEGEYFSPGEVHASPSTQATAPGYRFTLRDQVVLRGAVDARQARTLERMVHQGPERLHGPS